jgi:monoamine oxidase
MTTKADVLVIGAGVAGLAAARSLVEAGRRVWTVRVPNAGSVELGAEFIHGRAPAIFKLVQSAGLEVREVGGSEWIHAEGRLQRCEEFFSRTKSVIELMNNLGPDRSFAHFLDDCSQGGDEDKLWGLEYIEGFHGALAERISVHSLVRSRKAESAIEGSRSFRFVRGYQTLLKVFKEALPSKLVHIRLNTIVQSVHWSKQQVRVQAQTPYGLREFSAPHAIVTLPLGVLKAPLDAPGAVRFDPPLEDKMSALHRLYMGQTIRISMHFREPWWEQLAVNRGERGVLRDMSFVYSHQEWFPTWWTKDTSAPVLTGWAASRRGERLSGRPDHFIKDKAIESLSAIFDLPHSELESMLMSWHVHDWQSDPYSRGSYSYVGVGGEGAQAELAQPLASTLFFAGEATDTTGHHATVHGAIASGERAARELLG